MSKFDEQLEKYESEFKNTLKMSYDADFLRKVAKGCGVSIYNADARTVSGSDKKELIKWNSPEYKSQTPVFSY